MTVSMELQQCIAYFEDRAVYRKLFNKVREKYASLGHLGGAVQLSGLNEEERSQLGGFFQKDFSSDKTVTVTFASMERALEHSRFAGLDWEDILRGYFGEELIAKKEQRHAWQVEREYYFAGILENAQENPGCIWLKKTLQTHEEGYRILMKQYRESPEQLRGILQQFFNAVPRLPFLECGKRKTELLAVFAAETTGNPHFFDTGMLGEQLLIAFLKTYLKNSVEKAAFHAEQKAALLYEAGLLKDDLSNHTLVYGIRAWSKDGTLHEGVEGFVNRKEPMFLTLRTLSGLKKACTAHDVYLNGLSDKNIQETEKRIYIVENPAVFSTLVHAWPDAAIVCGNGQIRLATFVLLDLFDAETIFFYAGDFDPEGLQIAQRLRERYGERLRLWNYRRDLYDRYCSDVEITGKRLKKLEKIYLKELQEIRDALQENKRAAYQETMLEEYLRRTNCKGEK